MTVIIFLCSEGTMQKEIPTEHELFTTTAVDFKISKSTENSMNI